MKEQLNVIADVLESETLEWNCAFNLKKHVGEHDYDIVIERKKNRLELTAKIPVRVNSDSCSMWARRICEANADVECGRFGLCDDDRCICYRVYTLYTSESEIKDSAAIKTLLGCCDKALKLQSETILMRKRRRSVIEWFLDQFSITNGEAIEVRE